MKNRFSTTSSCLNKFIMSYYMCGAGSCTFLFDPDIDKTYRAIRKRIWEAR